MKLKIDKLSQRDARWRLKRLGNTSSTIGKYGCLLTCHSMAFQLAGIQQTPDILNETYKAGGVYDRDLIHFWSIPNVFPQIKAESFEDYYDTGAPVEEFYKWLDRGLPVIVLVDFDLNPADGVDMHFVLLIGYDDETRELLCIDPYTGEEYYFSTKYGDPARFIYGHRFYSWEIEHEPTCEEKVISLERTLKKRDEHIAQLSQEVGYYIAQLKDQEDDNLGFIEEAREERDKRVEADRKKLEAETKLEKELEKTEKLSEQLSDRVDEVKALKLELEASARVKIKQFSIFKVLKMYFSKEVDK